MTVENISCSIPRTNVADPAGSNPHPPDHQSDGHPNEPLRLAGLGIVFSYFIGENVLSCCENIYGIF